MQGKGNHWAGLYRLRVFPGRKRDKQSEEGVGVNTRAALRRWEKLSRRLPISASARCNKERCRCAAWAAADAVGPATTAAAPAKLPDPPPPPPPPPPAPTPLLIASSNKPTQNGQLRPQGPSFGGRRSPIWIWGSLGLGLLKRISAAIYSSPQWLLAPVQQKISTPGITHSSLALTLSL